MTPEQRGRELRVLGHARRLVELHLADAAAAEQRQLDALADAVHELDELGPIADPRRLAADVAGDDDPHGVDNVIVDASRAILLDYFETVLVRTGPSSHAVGLLVAGRVNRTSDRARVLALTDADGAAGVVSEVVALSGRAEAGGLLPGFRARIGERLDALAAAGNDRPKGAG